MAASTEGEGPPIDDGGHEWLGFVPHRRRRPHVAVCSCGWLSAPCSSAGLAGAAIEVHQGEHRA